MRQFIGYCFIGLTGAGLDVVLFLLFYNYFDFNSVLSNILSVSAGIIDTFLLNAFFNFKVTDDIIKRFVVYYSVGFFGLLFQAITIYILSDIIGINANNVKISLVPIVAVMQYLLNKYLSFSKLIGSENEN